jgi:FkbM family methyltransferase
MTNRKAALSRTTKLLHVGANKGQEAATYSSLGIQAWHIEAIPEIYKELVKALKPFPDQYPLNKCLSSSEGVLADFNISSNGGLSSSLLGLGRHEYAYPSVRYTEKIQLRTSTIDGMMRDGEIPGDIEYMLIDAQGAELMILEGAKHFLSQRKLKFALVETSIEPLYQGGAHFLDVASFLRDYGIYLRDVAFNNRGWADAFFQTCYWPSKPPITGVTGSNIAPDAICTQSSSWGKASCVERMSGIKTGRYCFHTALEEQPWIKMEFDHPRDISKILVYNREDCCQNRAFNLNIYASCDGEKLELIHENSAPYGGITSGPLHVECNVMAKSLLFRLRDRSYFHLDQIEIISQGSSVLRD